MMLNFHFETQFTDPLRLLSFGGFSQEPDPVASFGQAIVEMLVANKSEWIR